MIDIPPEIWHRVIYYLPLSSLLHLYEVNRVFFDIAMDEKYRQVALDHSGVHLTRTLDSLLSVNPVSSFTYPNDHACLLFRNPDIARRVKSLRIAPHIFCGTNQDEIRAWNAAPTRYLSLVGRIMTLVKKPWGARTEVHAVSCPRKLPPDRWQTAEALLKVARNLINVSNFYLDWKAFEEIPALYLDLLWPTMSSALQDMTIFATTTKLKTLFPLPVVHFPCLTSLRVTIKCRKDPSEDESDLHDIQLAIASLANSVRHTLHSLSVCCPPGHDLSPFYGALGDFRNLSSIDIDLTAELTSMPGGILHMQSIQFLLRHQETIEHIAVSASKLLVIKQSGGIYWFPRLKSFSLGSNILTVCSEQTQAFLRDHACTLRCLELVGPISPLELDELLMALSGESRRSALTKLSISIYRLDLNLMLKLVNCLPSLKTLKLAIMRVANGTSFAFTPGQFFPLHLV